MSVLVDKTWRRPRDSAEHERARRMSIASPPSHTLFWCEHREPMEIDEPWDYDFLIGQKVLVRIDTDDGWGWGWTTGTISREQPHQRMHEDGSLVWFYSVVYRVGRTKQKALFAPMAGGVKPDEPYYRKLVPEDEWLQ